jgi:phosphate transport system permease protein
MKSLGEAERGDHAYAGLARRHRRGKAVFIFFWLSTLFAVLSLATLLWSVLANAFGYVLLRYETDPAEIMPAGIEWEKADAGALAAVLRENLSPRRLKALESQYPLIDRKADDLRSILEQEILKPDVIRSWGLGQSIFGRRAIHAALEEEIAAGGERAFLSFRAWLNPRFLAQAQSSDALYAGVRMALLGSFMTILITILVALPLGTGAAIYLEEYAPNNRLTRFIQTNIYNLAGVPSIIYGMLGLTIFVRLLSPLTSGAIFGALESGDAVNGRTVLSASLTLSLLILPIIIINAQEAIRAVPRGLRESSLALGATRWQTILHHVLPASMDRILTGAVLAVSRAIGETAPLVLVGASTFLTRDPTGLFSKFTTLPIQIYQWTARPQAEFRNIAAAAILVLLALLLSLNATAIVLRNRFRREKRSA